MGDEEENMLQNVDFEAIITVYVCSCYVMHIFTRDTLHANMRHRHVRHDITRA